MKKILDGIIDAITIVFGLIVVGALILFIIGVVFTISYYIGYSVGWVVEFLTGIHTIPIHKPNFPIKEAFGYFFMFLVGVASISTPNR